MKSDGRYLMLLLHWPFRYWQPWGGLNHLPCHLKKGAYTNLHKFFKLTFISVFLFYEYIHNKEENRTSQTPAVSLLYPASEVIMYVPTIK